MNKVKIELLEWQARIVLEAITELESKWRHINRTTTDEDEQADYGNDLIELAITKDDITKLCTEAFGKGITDFSRKSL